MGDKVWRMPEGSHFRNPLKVVVAGHQGLETQRKTSPNLYQEGLNRKYLKKERGTLREECCTHHELENGELRSAMRNFSKSWQNTSYYVIFVVLNSISLSLYSFPNLPNTTSESALLLNRTGNRNK